MESFVSIFEWVGDASFSKKAWYHNQLFKDDPVP
jgi:hypothetical protein